MNRVRPCRVLCDRAGDTISFTEIPGLTKMPVPQVRVRSLDDNLGGRTLAGVRPWFLVSDFHA